MLHLSEDFCCDGKTWGGIQRLGILLLLSWKNCCITSAPSDASKPCLIVIFGWNGWAAANGLFDVELNSSQVKLKFNLKEAKLNLELELVLKVFDFILFERSQAQSRFGTKMMFLCILFEITLFFIYFDQNDIVLVDLYWIFQTHGFDKLTTPKVWA